MTKEELAAYEIKPISEIIPYWDKLSDLSKAIIESAFNLEWWRGYHAPRPATMRHVRMGQPAPEGDTHIILGAEDYERWRLVHRACQGTNVYKSPFDHGSAANGMFRDHSCWKCLDGKKACVVGNQRRCEYPHARND